MMIHYWQMLLLLIALPLASAQGFFEQFFGGGHQHQHQPSPSERWRAHGASIDCRGYLCPATFDCVSSPADCPCPNLEDVKCSLNGGDSYICARGDVECAQIKRLQKAA